MERIKVCCICGNVFEGWGNNPWPLKGDSCCNECNDKYVIPARLLYRATNQIPTVEQIDKWLAGEDA